MTEQLQTLEIDCCRMMNQKGETVLRSQGVRAKLENEVSSQRSELATNLLSANTAQAGIITWVKANANLDVNPEPINLKETLKFLMDHEDYSSNGYELYDFFCDDVDIQFDKIMQILFNKDTCQDKPSTKRYAIYMPHVCSQLFVFFVYNIYLSLLCSKLSFPPYERMKALHCPDSGVTYTKLVDSMLPIIQTSTAVLEQVVSGSIKVSHSTGNYFCVLHHCCTFD